MSDAVSAIREPLRRWYRSVARDLPWRRTRDPYAIWVSEVMLQQTRVDTVIPYYERFLARFPTVHALAEAPLDDVLARWSGLGYYRRARLLHRGAQAAVERHGGEVPKDRSARLALPGIGKYTAGAIGSIAFDAPEPIVDGNVARVLSRVLLLDDPLGTRASERALWEAAERIALTERPGEINQAMMELGATVCTPRQPSCLVCPIGAECGARAEGRQAELPVPKPKKKPKEVSLVAVVATRGRGATREVFCTRSADALFGGLFGPPMAVIEEDADAREGARRALAEAEISARLASEPAGEVAHLLTHRRLSVTVFRATHARAAQDDDRRPLDAAARQQVGISTLAKKIFASVGEENHA